MRGSSGIDVSTRDVSLSLVCALGGRSVGGLFGRCRGVVAAADGELCRQAHKLCVVVMSDLSVCNVHAARVCERLRRAVRGAWVALRGLSVEGGYATRRYSHDASVACRARPTSGSGRCERSKQVPSWRRSRGAGLAPYRAVYAVPDLIAVSMAGFRRSPLVAWTSRRRAGRRASRVSIAVRPVPARGGASFLQISVISVFTIFSGYTSNC